ncbi:DNA uptake protein [Spiroplasma corruscae]|uniref:DNA uptake protein n=1 Tax=Spiroplasma corruscae TaxID=216934 RepID=A0A222EPM6_9MOLU|nr:ComEC/Rec2 family competence protein [Spiroplasma corruscae]ASP28224.1 DNA uptake protein [Spiroplasma corruscae]
MKSSWKLLILLLTFQLVFLIFYYIAITVTNEGIFNVVEVNEQYIIVKRLFVKYYIKVGGSNYSVGEYVYLKGELFNIDKTYVKWGFDFNEYLLKSNIKFELINTSINKRGTNNLRYYFINFMNSGNKLVNLMLFQNKKNDLIYKNLIELGIPHLVNFGGMNLYILDRIFDKKLFRSKNYYKTVKIIFLVFILFYNYILGFKLFITKSITGVLFRFLKQLKFNNLSGWNSQSLQWIILLWINPFYIYSIGFLYSILFLVFFINFFDNKYKKKKHYFYNYLLLNSLILPLQVYFNYKFLIFSSLFELFLFPIISISFIFVFFLPFFQIISNFIYDVILNLTTVLKYINISILVGNITISILIIYYISLRFMQFSSTYCNKKKIITFIMYVFSSVSIIQYNQVNYWTNSITMLNVGNGNSFLLKKNNTNIIFDAGAGYGYSETIYKNFLEYKGIRKIDLVFISHNHLDHYNQLKKIQELYKINKIYYNDNVDTYINYKNIEILNFVELGNKDENDNSIVSLLNINNTKILFMGDSTKKSESRLLLNNDFLKSIEGGIDFLQVGHHGSKTSSSNEFINTIKPKSCYISSKHEKYKNFPSDETIETLKNNKCQIFTTNSINNYEYNINTKSTKKIKKTSF